MAAAAAHVAFQLAAAGAKLFGASGPLALKIGAGAVKAGALALKVGALAGINAAIANQNRPRQQGGLITLTINPDEPRRLQIGKRMNAGVLVDWYVKGSKNNQLFMVIYLGEGPMGQVTRVFSGGRAVHTTPLVHGTRTNIPGFRSTEGGASGNRLWITYYDGRPGQTADSTLVAASVGWNSNHVGTGCAYAIVECLWDSDNLRTPPSLAFEMEGAKVYDRRLDTTAGGSGSHRANDPSTWALTDNPAVALDHYLLGRYVGSVKQFGVGLDAEDVPYARFAALANLCDENVDLKATGTQKRYRANGFLFADRTYSDTIKDLCRAMNARPADFGGRIGIIDSEERTPVLTITDGDVIEDIAEQYSPKRSWGELVSVVRGTYQDPLQNYQAAEYPRVSDTDWVTEDGGSPKEATLDLEMETSAERAQRLAYLYAVRERRQAQLTGTYGLRMIELEQGDWFIRSGGVFGTSPGKVFEVIDRALDVASMTVTLTAFEVDPADSAWDETTAADPLPEAISSDDLLQAMEVPSLTVTGITLTGTAAQLPAIRVQWTAPDDPRVRQILVEAVPAAGGVPTSAIVDVATGEVTFTSGVTDDTDYLVRARFIGTFTPSAWTSNVAVTTLGDYAVGEATSVPWSGVTGAGRPADNADVTAANTAAGIAGQGALATKGSVDLATGEVTNKTASNIVYSGAVTMESLKPGEAGANVTESRTAAAIAGQGWGATASEASASNALIPLGGNRAAYTRGERLDSWTFVNLSMSSASQVSLSFAGRLGVKMNCVASAAGQSAVLQNGGPTAFRIPITPGQRYALAADIETINSSGGGIYAVAFDSTGTLVLYQQIAAFGANVPFLTTYGGFFTGPASTSEMYIDVYLDSAAAGACSLVVSDLRVIEATANQTALPPWSPGRQFQQIGADVTASNIASGFVGQNWGATASAAAAQTSIGTAAAIAGQGWGATAAEAAASNALVAYGANALTNTEFDYSTAHPPVGWENGWDGTAATAIQRDYSPALDNVKVAGAVALGTPAAGTVFDNINSGSASRLPVRPGDLVCGSALVECLGSAPAAQTSVAILFRTQNGSYISEAHSATISNANFPLDSVTKFQRGTVFATSPATAAYAELFQRAYCNGGAFPAVYMLRPMLALVRAGTTAAPEYSPGVAYRQADPTSENTASAITGQGVWATGNYYEQTSDPGSVPNGSFWFKTDTNEFYVRRSGAWGKVATIANQNITISRTNGFVKTRIGAGTITSDSVSFSSTGGSGTGYTYAHELFATYTTGPTPTISSASGSPITASAAGAVPGDEVRGFVQTTVTDSAGNKTTLTSPVALFCES